MTYCTEHKLLPERPVSPPRKRKRRTAAVARKRPKLEWPKIAPKHVRVFVLSCDSTEPSILDFPKSDHLEGLRDTCQSQDIDKIVVGPVLNKKNAPSGRELVVYHAEDSNKTPNTHLPEHHLLGTVVLGAQSVKTGNFISVKASDIGRLAQVAKLGAEQQEALKQAAIEAGGIRNDKIV